MSVPDTTEFIACAERPAQRAVPLVSKLLAEAHVFLDKEQMEDVETQLGYVVHLRHTGAPVTEEDNNNLAELRHPVTAKKILLAKFSPPKAPEVTMLAVGCQEPALAHVPYDVSPPVVTYEGQFQECGPCASEPAQDFQEGV